MLSTGTNEKLETNASLAPQESIYVGKVVFFKKSYGFIEWAKDGVKQKDMFVHWSDISSEGYKTLTSNQEVTFKIGTNKHGDLKAVEVIATGTAPIQIKAYRVGAPRTNV